jgi:hypothetical protein
LSARGVRQGFSVLNEPVYGSGHDLACRGIPPIRFLDD